MTEDKINKVGEKEMGEKKVENKKKEVKDVKAEEKKTEEKKKINPKKLKKKDTAFANGYNLRISPKQSVAICKVLKGKTPGEAVRRLEAVIEKKRVIPMAGLEVGHKKGKGLAGAKYPKNACKAIIEIIKQAGANSIVNGIEDPVIFVAKSNRASAPYRKGGRRAKRTHIYIEIREKKYLADKNKEEKK